MGDPLRWRKTLDYLCWCSYLYAGLGNLPVYPNPFHQSPDDAPRCKEADMRTGDAIHDIYTPPTDHQIAKT